MNVFPVFEMGVWVFAPLCWPFLHTVSDFIYFWIFGVFVPKGQMGFNFEFFSKFEIFTSFCVPPYFFSIFFGTMWVVDLDDPFGYQSDHCFTFMLHWDAYRICTLDLVFSWVMSYLLLWFPLDLCFGFVDTRIHVESILSD